MIGRNIVIIFCTLASICSCQLQQYQQKSSKDAAILSEARYLSANGQFGSAYSQDDGVEFKEESDGAGNRRGSYSYVDPTGKKRTVTYTAGKDGFRATGDHIPVPAAPAVPMPPARAPERSAIQQYDDIGSDWKDKTESEQSDNDYNMYDSGIPDQNPRLYNNNPVQYNPNPMNFQYQSPSFPTNGNKFGSNNNNNNYYNSPSSESPRRSYPPGKVSLSRSPDGFSYTFNTV